MRTVLIEIFGAGDTIKIGINFIRGTVQLIEIFGAGDTMKIGINFI
jgi:hypothetical protein